MKNDPTGATGEAMSSGDEPIRPDLMTAIENCRALFDLAAWLALDAANRIDSSERGPGYHINRGRGDQLMALLIVSEQYAERIVDAHEGAVR